MRSPELPREPDHIARDIQNNSLTPESQCSVENWKARCAVSHAHSSVKHAEGGMHRTPHVPESPLWWDPCIAYILGSQSQPTFS